MGHAKGDKERKINRGEGYRKKDWERKYIDTEIEKINRDGRKKHIQRERLGEKHMETEIRKNK